MAYAIPALPTIAIPVAGSTDEFPVHRIYCVGRNYAAHAREMGHASAGSDSGHDPIRDAPLFFCKPTDALLYAASDDVGRFQYPALSQDVHYEVELVVAIGMRGRDIAVTDASRHIFGYAVGLDMTRRDLHRELQKKSHPWEIAKGFDGSAPIGPIHRKSAVGEFERGEIRLDVNDEMRQHGDLTDMIWSVPQIIFHLSRFFELMPGDLIYTGTPEGVGPIVPGDRMRGGIERLGNLEIQVG